MRTSPNQSQIILRFIPDWLAADRIGEVFHQTPLHFSRMFSVPKGNTDWRPIIDLSPLNLLLKKKHFRMEHIWKVATCISRGMWAVKLDLQDAYLHIRLHPSIWHLFAFTLGDRVFYFKVLPFGLSTAPWAFTRLMKAVKRKLRILGIVITSFLDDFIILARSYQEALDHTSIVISLLQSLGLTINWKKSSPAPARRLEYLGVVIDLVSLTFSLPQSKVDKVKTLIQSTSAPFLRRKDLDSLVGFLSFAADFLPLGRLLLKPIQRWVNANSSPLQRYKEIPLDGTLRDLLRPWVRSGFLEQTIPILTRSPTITLMTDSSDLSWAGVLLPHKVRGDWNPSQLDQHINWKELKAVHLSLIHFLPLLRGKCVSLRADNTVALACLRKQGSLRSSNLWDLSKEILELTLAQGITLVPKHIKGVLNVLADKGSRSLPIETEWSLDRETFLFLCSRFGNFALDCFATWDNKQCPCFVSPCPDPRAWAEDAFSLNWSKITCPIYVFPPAQLMDQLVHHLKDFRGKGVVIASYWPSKPWFTLLSRRCPRSFPLPEGYFLHQETSQGIVIRPQVFDLMLHAWEL